jgi:hypothetical protein
MTKLSFKWKSSSLKALRVFPLFLTLIISACAQLNTASAPMGISTQDHEALALYYEDLSREAQIGLQVNKKQLQEYEKHAYYFGRQGQDIRSHTLANIRAYEIALRENQIKADHHKKIAITSQNNSTHKAKVNEERDFILKNTEKSVKNNL